MNSQKLKSDSYCVEGKHRSTGEITFNKNTGKEIKLLVGKCETSNRKNQ